MIKTRFAPSPTGDPHIGNIRTALFAYLFAKHEGGKFLLRIEDTDQKRYDEKSIEVIKDVLSWLDIKPENLDSPMIQSQRLEIYKKEAMRLLEQGDAYVCNCSKERLAQVRDEQAKASKPTGYDGHCRDLNLEYTEGCVIRIKVPREKVTFRDLIRGEVSFQASAIDDQIILKSDGFPTYHLAHVVDDNEMKITHVIRSEEWLPSTAKHIILNKMLGFNQPDYAHVPVILSPSGGKLSKRDGAVGILSFKHQGYLPEALINYMALLGWNPKTDEEFFTLEELIKRFELKNVNKAGAIFDQRKLDNINRTHLLAILSDRDRLISLLDGESAELINSLDRGLPSGQSVRDVLLDLIVPRISKLSEFSDHLKIFIGEVALEADLLVFKKSNRDNTLIALTEFSQKMSKLEENKWIFNEIKMQMEQIVEENELSNGDVFWPIRYALSGEEKSPPPEEMATILGKQKTLERIERAISVLS